VKKTLKNGVPLVDYYNLCDEKIQTVADLLFRKTNGHPRMFVEFFLRCNSQEELVEVDENFGIANWKYVEGHVLSYRRSIQELLKGLATSKKVDMTSEVHGMMVLYWRLV
jgi:hypothetical protein